jgi:MerR family transcriptional regulator, light-induced transcriptional regulator
MERTYRIHIASEMSGVSEGLIRAWERRYGVIKPRRTGSGYRAYTEADIAVLKRLKKLTQEGVAIADAVRLVPQIRREVKDDLEARDGTMKAPQDEQFARWRHDVLVAAERLDQQSIEEALDEAMASLPPVVFFDEVLAPLQREVGERWHQGRLTVAEEHLVTQAARQRVLALLHQAPRRAKHHVVCACFPEEDHELGLMGVALRFRHGGWRVTFLGARTPPDHLARVVRTVKPDLVALSAVNDDGEADFERTLQAVIDALPPHSKVAVGGAATVKHAPIVKRLGVVTIATNSEWETLLVNQ